MPTPDSVRQQNKPATVYANQKANKNNFKRHSDIQTLASTIMGTNDRSKLVEKKGNIFPAFLKMHVPFKKYLFFI